MEVTLHLSGVAEKLVFYMISVKTYHGFHFTQILYKDWLIYPKLIFSFS
jgi:hypothetical protein